MVWWKAGRDNTRALRGIAGLIVIAATAACSASQPPAETATYREGRQAGFELRETGTWPDISRTKAEALCERSYVVTLGLTGTEAEEFTDGCATELIAD
ncbi:hypothetical protein ABZ621_34120 [Streptomyces sp. NPDC007863]|uniref:hypothetical protein n=1 Tax=Streptomyces sp. NPDC007863 TaxID=3154894 RepID=UPI0033CB5C93